MDHELPLETFRPFAAWMTETDGEISYCNAKAAELLNVAPDSISGRRCWEVVRLIDGRGERFCKPGCRVRRGIEAGARRRHRVLCLAETGARSELELLTFSVPPGNGRDGRVLHLLVPVAEQLPDRVAAGRARARLERLTAREEQVLDLLARGTETSDIASRLYISPATVRNHIQHILAKLGVHGRLQAILTLLSGREGAKAAEK